MLLALLLAVQAAPAASGPDVVVTGERLKKLHDQCRQGKCSPLRDAQASIAWAEAQFRDGRYVDAKTTLRDAAARNARHERTHPKPVAAIYEAYATVAWQEGDQDVHRRAVFDRVRTLRDNLPADDVAVRAARSAVGEMWQRLENPQEADRAFEAMERDASAAGRHDEAIRARLLRARSQHIQKREADALRLVEGSAAMPGADRPESRAAIRAMRVRLAAHGGGDGAIEAAVREFRVAPGAGVRPALVWAPPYPLTAEQLAAPTRGRFAPGTLSEVSMLETLALTSPKPEQVAMIRWADVGFFIRPDGRTADIEVLRGTRSKGWVQPYLGQIAARRYAASALPADDPGHYRIERFTLRPGYLTPTGSLARRRGGVARLEVVDLTDPNAKVTAAR